MSKYMPVAFTKDANLHEPQDSFFAIGEGFRGESVSINTKEGGSLTPEILEAASKAALDNSGKVWPILIKAYKNGPAEPHEFMDVMFGLIYKKGPYFDHLLEEWRKARAQ
jgi:hypothetical protein